jgi:hypothetical protein
VQIEVWVLTRLRGERVRASRIGSSVLVALMLVAALMPQSVVAANASTATDPSSPSPSAKFPFTWRGGTQPLPAENSISGGGYVSVSFSLGGYRGKNIFLADMPHWHRYACVDGETFPYDDHATSPRDGNGLKYDKATDTYTYTWRVWQQWVNTCRFFEMALKDGSVHVAQFRINSFDWVDPTQDWWATNDALAGSTLHLGFEAHVGSPTKVLSTTVKTTSQRMDCQTNDVIPDTRRAEPGVSLQVVDAAARQYSLTWPTTRAWIGTCRQLQMTLADGSLQIAKFRFHDYQPLIKTSHGATAYTENGAPVAVDPRLSLRDDGAALLMSATARITTGRQPADRLAFTAFGGISGAYDTSTGVLSLTGAATVADYRSALRSVTFASSSDSPGTHRIVRFRADDGSHEGNTANKSIAVTPVDDAPVVTTSAGVVNYVEGDPDTPIDTGLTLTDPDSANMAGARVAITAGLEPATDHLGFSNQHGISGNYDAASGVLTLSGTASKADYRTALRSVTFRSTSSNPAASKTVGFTVNDGSLNSNTATRDIAIGPSDNPPTVTTSSGSTAYTEQAPATVVDSGVTVGDPDSANLQSATVSISAGFQAGDTLGFSNQNGISGTYHAGTGVLNLTGSASLANYQLALQSITFSETSDTPTPTRTISFTVNDGTLDSNTATKGIAITAVDDAPVAVADGYSTSEETPLSVNAATGVLANDTDVDTAHGSLTAALVTPPSHFSAFTLHANGSFDYTPATNFTGTDTFTYKANDGSLDSNTVTVTITVTEVNHAPVLDASKTPVLNAENEDPGAPSGAVGTPVSKLVDIGGPLNNVSDADAGAVTGIAVTAADTSSGSWSYSTDGGSTWHALGAVSGTSARLLAANASTRLYFLPTTDFNGSVSPALTFRAWDQTSGSNGQAGVDTSGANHGGSTAFSSATDTADLTINAVDDAPVAVPDGYSIPEDVGILVLVGVGVLANDTDIDTPHSSLTAVLVTPPSHATSFTLNADGSFDYTPVTNFNGTDTFTYKANDGSLDSNTVTVTITVNPVDDPPVVTTSSGSGSYTENAAGLTIDPAVTVTDIDSTNLTLATVSISGGFQAGDVLAYPAPIGSIASTYNPGTGVLTLSGSDTVANYQLALQSITFSETSDTPNPTRTISFTVNDGTLDSNTATKGIAITPVNDPPVVTTSTGAVSYSEGDPATAIDPGLSVTDPDSANLSGATIAITGNFASAEDVLGFVNTPSITGSYSPATGLLTLTGADTLANYQAALRTVTYQDTSANPSTSTRTITFNATDSGGATSSGATRDIQVASVNTPPVVTTSSGTTAYTENAAPQTIDPGISVSDVDNTTLAGATVSISAGLQSGDTLSFTPLGSITGTYHSGTGVLDLTGSDTLANYQTALASVTFYESDDNPTASRTVSFLVSDGTDFSNIATKDIAITPVNDPPVVTTSAGALSVNEGDPPTAIDPALTITDPDSANLSGATVQITSNLASSEDVLGFAGTPSITGSYSSATGLLTLTGADTVANYQAALRTVTYQDTSANPSTLFRTVTFTVTDSGGATSNGATRDVHVASVNTPPVVTTSSGTTAYTENAAGVAVDGSVTVSDVDNTTLASATVSISSGFQAGDVLGHGACPVGSITCSYNAATGVLTLIVSDSLANYQAFLRSITFSESGDNPSTSRTISFLVNDGTDDSNTATKNIAITPVNDPPVVTTSAGTTAYTEHASAVAIDAALTVSDPDNANLASATVSIGAGFQPGDTLTFVDTPSITGLYNTGSGVLSLSGSDTVANYQAALRSITFASTSDNPPATETISFLVNDGTDPSNAATKDIAITPVNDPPTVTTTVGSLAYIENDPATKIDQGLTVTDVDSPTMSGATVQITGNLASGEDVLGFTNTATITGSYTAATGLLTLTGADTLANYQAALQSVTYQNTSDNPSALARTVTFIVTDSGAASSSGATKDIAITPVNDAPTVTTTAGSVAYTENDPASVIDPALTVTDPDSANLSGATIQITGNYASSEDVLAFVNTATITGSYSGLTGLLTLTGTDTAANYQAAMRTVTYQNTSDNPSALARTVTFMAIDSGGATSSGATRGITVIPVNDPPVLTVPGAQTFNEDTTRTFSAANLNAITVADVDAASNSVQLSISVSHGTLTLSGTAGLSFGFPADANGAPLGDGTADPSMVFRGTISSINTALDGLIYTPSANYNSTRGSESISVTVNDLGNTGSGGAQLDNDSVALIVSAVADAPVAAAKSFNVGTNLTINLTGLLTGATDPDDGDNGGAFTSTYTLTSVTAGTCTGCTISNLNAAAGSVDVDPPADTTGSLTLNYTITDSGSPGGGQVSAAATITLTISGPTVWFVDGTNGNDSTGKGTLGSPFKTLGKAATVDASGDGIFLYSGTYTDGIALNSSEKLVGQGTTGTSFDTIFGLTGGNAPPTGTKARPTLATGSVTLQGTVTLASSDLLRGLSLSTATITGLSGSGGLTGVDVDQTSISTTTGTALSLNNVAGSLTLSTVDVNGAATGISLTNVGASVTINGGEVKNTTTSGIIINQGAGNITDSGKVTVSAGQAIAVTNVSAGAAIAFSGAVSATGGTGVLLDNNDQGGSGGGITFSGGVTLSTATNAAFTATNGGKVTVTAPAGIVNTLTTTSNTALTVTNTTIGSGGLTFRSISSNGAINGILLTSTGTSGGLTVTGNSGVGTGGTIQHSSSSGVLITSSVNVNLSWMTISANGNAGGEDGIRLIEVTGTGGLSNLHVSGSYEDNIYLNDSTGTLSAFTISGGSCVITDNDSAAGNTGITVLSRLTANMTVTIDGCSFQGNRSDTIHVDGGDTGILSATITNNVITAGSPNQGNIGIDVTVANNSAVTYQVENNKIGTPDGTTVAALLNTGINIFNGTLATSGTPASITGTVKNNTIFNDPAAPVGSSNGFGIRVFNQGYGSLAANISGNKVRNVNTDYGIFVEVSSNSGVAAASANATVGVTNNDVSVNSGALDAIRVQARGRSVMNARINSNTTGTHGSGFFGLTIRQASQTIPSPGGTVYTATFNLEGLTTGLQSAATTTTYLDAQNPAVSGGTDVIVVTGITGVASVTGIP